MRAAKASGGQNSKVLRWEGKDKTGRRTERERGGGRRNSHFPAPILEFQFTKRFFTPAKCLSARTRRRRHAARRPRAPSPRHTGRCGIVQNCDGYDRIPLDSAIESGRCETFPISFLYCCSKCIRDELRRGAISDGGGEAGGDLPACSAVTDGAASFLHEGKPAVPLLLVLSRPPRASRRGAAAAAAAFSH